MQTVGVNIVMFAAVNWFLFVHGRDAMQVTPSTSKYEYGGLQEDGKTKPAGAFRYGVAMLMRESLLPAAMRILTRSTSFHEVGGFVCVRVVLHDIVVKSDDKHVARRSGIDVAVRLMAKSTKYAALRTVAVTMGPGASQEPLSSDGKRTLLFVPVVLTMAGMFVGSCPVCV